MATYFVGDIQGCFLGLMQLLDKIKFSRHTDTLWCVGDLVGRGPQPEAVLRFLKDLDNRALCVLGNHDLHCLAASQGVVTPKPSDHLDSLLHAQDANELLEWLRTRPFLIQHPQGSLVMVHAGIPAHWSLTEATLWAEHASQRLCSSTDYLPLLRAIYTDDSMHWDDMLDDFSRCVYTISALTRMRYCYADTRLDFTHKTPPQNAAQTCLKPWFEQRNPLSPNEPSIVFGHWSALEGKTHHTKYQALDTGYIWGGQLTAWCLETNERTHVQY